VSDGPKTPPNMTLPPRVTASIDVRRARARSHLAIFCGVSFALHIVLVLAYVFWPQSAHAAVNLDDAIVKTKLVKLGKERDPKLLPRKDASPPPDAASSKSKPNTEQNESNPQKDASTKQSAADILNQLKEKERSVNDLIREKIGEQTDEGREDGDKEGNALDGEIEASYLMRVKLAVEKNLKHSISPEEGVGMRCELALQIDDQGNLVSARIQKQSKSSSFDNDVLAAAKRVGTFPAPPPPVRKLANSGFAFGVCPYSCN
jgi:TonB family protein